jgi:uncharacterized protein YbjT (DUF2867 family)
MNTRTVWIAGASGLVGGELLTKLLADDAFGRVISVGRKTLSQSNLKLTQATVDFTDPAAFASLPAPDAAFSCLGTTIKKAGSKEAFRAVDYDAVLTFARAAKSRGARAFIHVTSAGADSRSPMFYSAVKGQIEEALIALGFESLITLRPSILDGERSDERPLEKIGLSIGRALGPLLGKYRPTPATAVAAAMVAAWKSGKRGVENIEAGEIYKRFAK